jgi:lipoate-protein ligase A
MVRRIDVTDATIGTWGAIAALMREQIHRDEFEDTVVTLRWSEENPSLGIGTNEDADQVDVEGVREEGLRCGRIYHSNGGGSGIFTPELPLVLVYYQHEAHDKEENSLLKHFDELNGAANAAALDQVGLNGEYRSIGDGEVVHDGNRYKVVASAATNFPESEYWAAVSSIIWDAPPYGDLMDQVIDMPKEKFQDKDTDSLTARMRPISMLLDELGEDVSKDEIVDAFVEQNVDKIFGSDEEIVEGDWEPAEREAIEDLTPYFESDTWINRISTQEMCLGAPDHLDLGIAAYKSRKLIKASVLLDGDEIYDVQYSGDFYFRPALPATSTSLLDEMAAAIEGVDATDADALEAEIAEFFDQPNLEFPRLSPTDFVQPVVRAANNTQPVTEYRD